MNRLYSPYPFLLTWMSVALACSDCSASLNLRTLRKCSWLPAVTRTALEEPRIPRFLIARHNYLYSHNSKATTRDHFFLLPNRTVNMSRFWPSSPKMIPCQSWSMLGGTSTPWNVGLFRWGAVERQPSRRIIPLPVSWNESPIKLKIWFQVQSIECLGPVEVMGHNSHNSSDGSQGAESTRKTGR